MKSLIIYFQLKIAKELPANEYKWTVKVMAIDSGLPLPNYATTLLQIIHGDAKPTKIEGALFDSCSMNNENAPKFLDPKSAFEVNEDAQIGHEVGFIEANDLDQGYNGLIGYTTNDNYFGIDLYSGRLFVQKPLFSLLDASKKDYLMYEVEITARDQAFDGPKSATTKIQIRINDVNNHSPEFEKVFKKFYNNLLMKFNSQYSYVVRVAENTIPSDELLRLKANDLDSGSNGRVEYRLAVETDTIFVDPDTGSVRLERALDREQQDTHQFLVMAVDRGKPPKFGFANLTLIVEDKNDNAPVCSQHLAKLAEDSPNGQLVLCMAASDADLNENARLEFSMDENDVPFRIDQQTGCIFTNLSKPLDFEIQSTYGFNVTVSLISKK